MQRTAGKLAMFLGGIYLIALFGILVSTVSGDPIPAIGWPLMLLPGAAFVYSFIDAVKLHRTTDPATATSLWRRSLFYAVIGTALLAGAAIAISRMQTT